MKVTLFDVTTYRETNKSPGELKLTRYPGIGTIALDWVPLGNEGPSWGAYITPSEALSIAQKLIEAANRSIRHET